MRGPEHRRGERISKLDVVRGGTACGCGRSGADVGRGTGDPLIVGIVSQ